MLVIGNGWPQNLWTEKPKKKERLSGRGIMLGHMLSPWKEPRPQCWSDCRSRRFPTPNHVYTLQLPSVSFSPHILHPPPLLFPPTLHTTDTLVSFFSTHTPPPQFPPHPHILIFIIYLQNKVFYFYYLQKLDKAIVLSPLFWIEDHYPIIREIF